MSDKQTCCPGGWDNGHAYWCAGPKPVTMEATFTDVDPDVLGILTGGLLGTPKKPDFAIEFTTFAPVRRRAWRVVWEWLTRTPRRYTEHRMMIPHATVSRNPDGSMAINPIHQGWGIGPYQTESESET